MGAQIKSLSDSPMAATPMAWLAAGAAAAQRDLQRGVVVPGLSNPPHHPTPLRRDTDVSLARLLAALSHRPCFLAEEC